MLHAPSAIPINSQQVLYVAYPLVPWIGVMATGYALGKLLLQPAAERRRALLPVGGALTLAFIVLRASNLYGDPSPWPAQATPGWTLFSFVNPTKYPPSLLFLLMTLGPSILALPFPWLDGVKARRRDGWLSYS